MPDRAVLGAEPYRGLRQQRAEHHGEPADQTAAPRRRAGPVGQVPAHCVPDQRSGHRERRAAEQRPPPAGLAGQRHDPPEERQRQREKRRRDQRGHAQGRRGPPGLPGRQHGGEQR
ncbi:hypothetical protein [Micromonospora aurantiaca (nom. illeg.)]|uniref:hypothetical protein n=1 Tax=Micromonospora aurantiaca (nom. illeg.) TaxID=47850 RepID=UPI0033C91B6A